MTFYCGKENERDIASVFYVMIRDQGCKPVREGLSFIIKVARKNFCSSSVDEL